MSANCYVAPIYDVLTRAGITLRRGKLDCIDCHKRSIYVSVAKNWAKCYGCGLFWNLQETTVPDELDWATYLISSIAQECIENLIEDQEALDYLEHRSLPVRDSAWLAEQDLGSIPYAWVTDFKAIAARAKYLLEDASFRRLEQVRLSLATAAVYGAKALKAAKAEGDAVQADIAQEQKCLEHVTENVFPLLRQPKWASAIVYIYRDADGRPTSLNARIYGEEERRMMRLVPRPGKLGVFGGLEASYLPGDAWVGNMPPLLVVEGEHNALTLRALCHQWGVEHHISVVAVGGKSGADLGTLKELCADEFEPVIVYDNDRVDPATEKPGGFDLVRDISQELYCRALTTPTKDLDEFITSKADINPADILALLKTAVRVPLAMATMRKRVAAILEAPKMEGNARETAVTTLIVADCRRRCKLYNSSSRAVLVRPTTNGFTETIIVRHGDTAFEGLMRQFGIVQPKWIDACGKAFGIYADARDVPRRTLHSLSYWTGSALYINTYDGRMAKIWVIDGVLAAGLFPSGHDDVLMHPYDTCGEDASMMPWLESSEALCRVQRGHLRYDPNSVLDQTIYDCLIYEADALHHKQMLKAWVLAMFFAANMKSRPVVMFEGSWGSGKSSVTQRLGCLLLSPKFATTNSPKDPYQVAELMTGRPFVAFDEFDEVPKPVENAIKHLTTGGIHERRELYTTSTTVKVPCDAAIMVTTNTNTIKQAGSARRYIVVPVAARQTDSTQRVFQSVGEYLLPELMAKRSELWLELLGQLGSCVLALNNTRTDTKTAYSMGDFGVFVQRIAEYEGWGQEANDMFVRANHRQEDLQAATNNLFTALDQLLHDKPELCGQPMTSGQIAEKLQSTLPEYERGRKNRLTASGVAWSLRTHKDIFEKRLAMTIVDDKHAKQKLYLFRRETAALKVVA